MKVSVIITLKKDVLDPHINEVRQGKYFEININEKDKKTAEGKVEDMCKKLLANLVIENYKIIDEQ